MKLISISRGKLDIAKSQLWRPVMTVGRSPTCDVVLRASGVKPVHFLLEWIGDGEFDAGAGAWSIVDISNSSRMEEGAGVVLRKDSVSLADFTFNLVEDSLESKERIGGMIRESLHSVRQEGELDGLQKKPENCLEMVAISTTSGAVKDVRHLSPSKPNRKISAFPAVPELVVTWKAVSPGVTLPMLSLEKMISARVFSGAHAMEPSLMVPIDPQGLFRIQWEGLEFFLRMVPRFALPKRSKKRDGDALLLPIGAVVGAGSLLFLAAVFLFPPAVPEPVPPPRVATIEIAPPSVPKEETAPAPAAVPTETQSAALPTQTKVPSGGKTESGQAAMPRAPSPQKDLPKKAGLNAQAPRKEVNVLGMLGALKSKGGGKPSVQAESVVSREPRESSVSSSQGSSQVVLKQPHQGVVGAVEGSKTAGPGDSKGLASAATTLGGFEKYDPKSTGLLADSKGESLSSEGLGSGTKEGSGGKGGAGIGGLDGAGMQVAGGGLDRETVRRVVQSYRSQIRNCYDKALLGNSKLVGKLIFDWTISPTGPVTIAKLTQSTIGSGVLQVCVTQVIRKMVFPQAPNGKPTRVIYPFVFQSSG